MCWGKAIKVFHCGLVWSPRTLAIHVQSRHQNKHNQLILQYTSMTNDTLVHLNGMNKMGDFSHDEGYLHLSFWVLLVNLVTISRDVLDSVMKQHGLYVYAHNRVLCTCHYLGLLVHATLHVHSV